MVTGNKGEWSEYYAFLKLLVDRKLDFGGEDYKKLEGKYYPIIKVIRTENGESKSYEFVDKEKIRICSGDTEIDIVDGSDLKAKCLEIFKTISTHLKGPITVEVAGELMKRLRNSSLNAGNQLKEDIDLKIHDDITGSQPEIGFSIKSMVGGPATLLNASGSTNFTYEVIGLDKSKISEINAIKFSSKIRERLEAIKKFGGRLDYFDVDSETFRENLRLCDSIMPEMLSQMLILYYSRHGRTIEELIDQMVIGRTKVRGFIVDLIGYEHRITNLLYAVALGMVPNSPWDGSTRANGGYIIVREDGELVGYNIYKADIFRKYLLKTTKFDTGSSTRHKFGKVYIEKGKMYIKLNLQIRFLK